VAFFIVRRKPSDIEVEPRYNSDRRYAMKWNAEKYDRVNIQQIESGRELMALSNVKKTDSILDLGCGTGKLTAEMARLASRGSVTGIDSSAEMIKKARERCSGIRNITLKQIPAQAMPYAGRFDLVFSNLALQWINDTHRVSGLIYQSLKRGGRIAYQLPASNFSPEFFECIDRVIRDLGHEMIFRDWRPPWYLPTEIDYIEILFIVGFENVRVFPKKYTLKFESANDAVDWWSLGLSPYMEQLPEREQERFKYAFAMNSEHYRSNGIIEFGMNRLFAFGEK
jgi:trans-aconitate 2-methyltransferase